MPSAAVPAMTAVGVVAASPATAPMPDATAVPSAAKTTAVEAAASMEATAMMTGFCDRREAKGGNRRGGSGQRFFPFVHVELHQNRIAYFLRPPAKHNLGVMNAVSKNSLTSTHIWDA